MEELVGLFLLDTSNNIIEEDYIRKPKSFSQLLDYVPKTFKGITEYYNINTTKFQNKKTHPQFYWEKWIIMTTKNIPTIFFDKLLNVIDKNTWKILIVERGKNKISSSWEKYIKNNNVSDDVIYLSLESQKKLFYQTTKYISDNSYGRKNIGYLYAIEHGAKEILDIDI